MRYLIPILGIISIAFLLGVTSQGTTTTASQGAASVAGTSPPAVTGDKLILEGQGGGFLLLETGDSLLLE